MKVEDVKWDKVQDGDYFSAYIYSTPSIGRIKKYNDSIYFCQNDQDGERIDGRFGYKYSWIIDSNVKDIDIWDSEPTIRQCKFPKTIELNPNLKVTLNKGNILTENRNISYADVTKVYNAVKDKKIGSTVKIKFIYPDVLIQSTSIRIGCQTIPNKAVVQLYKSLVK